MNTQVANWRDFWQFVTDDGKLVSHLFLRQIWVSLQFIFGAMLLGVDVSIIALGLHIMYLRLFVYIRPLFLFWAKTMRLKDFSETFIPMPLSLYRLPSLLIIGLGGTYLVFTGAQMLILNGFCSQSFFCR
jgi:hypothetical protein